MSRVDTQLASTGIPAVTLPPLEKDKPTDEQEESEVPALPAPIKVSKTEDKPPKGKGTFATKSFTLKKTKRQ